MTGGGGSGIPDNYCPWLLLSFIPTNPTCDGTVDMARELLAWGANPYYIWKRPPPDARFPFLNGVRSSRLSARSLAITTSSTTADVTPGGRSFVALEREYYVRKKIEIMEELLAGGCIITPSVWGELCLAPNRFRALFQALTVAAGSRVTAIPVECMALALLNGYDVSHLGADIYWSPGCLSGDRLFEILSSFQGAHILLKVQMRTLRQKAYKALFCQMALLKLLTQRAPVPPSPCAVALFFVLLEQGATAHGWRWAQATCMSKIFMSMRLQSYTPCVVRHVRTEKEHCECG